jgi:hypothetical protein
LTEFLLARIATDKAAALAARPGGRWKVETEGIDGHGIISLDEHAEGLPDYPASILDDEGGAIGPPVSTMEHIARWDPARVLAECEAKRQIIEEYTTTVIDGDSVDRLALGSYRAGLSFALRVLAAAYASHKDYREEWRHE